MQRILAVLAAVLLVGAAALAMLVPPLLPLGQVLLMLDHDATNAVHTFIGRHFSEWIWSNVAMPLLLRPAWLVPAALGLICAGVATSVSGKKTAGRPHRRSQR
jgi:uncharacterized membrane protein